MPANSNRGQSRNVDRAESAKGDAAKAAGEATDKEIKDERGGQGNPPTQGGADSQQREQDALRAASEPTNDPKPSAGEELMGGALALSDADHEYVGGFEPAGDALAYQPKHRLTAEPFGTASGEPDDLTIALRVPPGTPQYVIDAMRRAQEAHAKAQMAGEVTPEMSDEEVAKVVEARLKAAGLPPEPKTAIEQMAAAHEEDRLRAGYPPIVPGINPVDYLPPQVATTPAGQRPTPEAWRIEQPMGGGYGGNAQAPVILAGEDYRRQMALQAQRQAQQLGSDRTRPGGVFGVRNENTGELTWVDAMGYPTEAPENFQGDEA